MKVALITTGQEVLGVEYLSAVLKKGGHDVKFFFDPQTFGGGIFLKVDYLQNKFDISEKVVTGTVEYQPDIIGFSCMTHNYKWSLHIAQRIKAIKNIPIIFGGIHPTSVPEQVLKNECIDMVAVGEAESSFLNLLETMENGNQSTNVKGIYFKSDGIIIKNQPQPLFDDLDLLPYPDKNIFYDKMLGFKNEPYVIMASRRCPFSCPYCCNHLIKEIYKGQRYVRRRSVDNVIDELQSAKTKFKIREVYFADEVFSFDLDWLEDFSVKYKDKINLPFSAYHHFKLCNEKHIKLLKNAGCYMLFFGMHSASERMRRDVCNRNYSNDKAMEVFRICRKYGMKITTDHIFGLPHETEEDLSESVEFYRNASPNMIYTYWLTYYPNTSIIEKAKEAGLINNEDIQRILDGEQSYYHKGTSIRDRKSLLTYQLLFDLIPLLPKRVHQWLTNRKWIIRILPKGYIPHFCLLFIVDLFRCGGGYSKIGGVLSVRKLRLLLSKKNVP